MKQPFMLFPNVESRVWAGIFTFTGMIILLAWVIINEEGRMEEFTQRFEGRSVETGAQLFESNCSACHGVQGYGLPGTAPALNNPVLFGFNFFADIDEQITAKTTELEALQGADPEREAELEAELGQLEAERLALEEELLYDYAKEYAELDEQLNTLNEQIETEYGVRWILFGPEVQNKINARDAVESELLSLQSQIDDALEAEEEPDPDIVAQRDELKAEFDVLDAEASAADALLNQQSELLQKVSRFQKLNDANIRIADLRQQIAEKEALLAELPPIPEDGDDPVAEERGALLDEIDALNVSLAEAEDDRELAREELIDKRDIVPYDTEALPRVEQLQWNGSLHDLVATTIISGRPVSANYWPRPMAAWSRTASGPLRDDQIENLVSYILNWDREFTIEDTRRIQQYAVQPIDPNATVSAPVGDDPDEIIAQLETLETEGLPEDAEEGTVVFDSNVGQQLFDDYGCATCHIAGADSTAPDIQGVALRAEEMVETHPELELPSGRYYLVQSIVLPEAFFAEGFPAGGMPLNFGDRLDIYIMSNIIAYLESLDN